MRGRWEEGGGPRGLLACRCWSSRGTASVLLGRSERGAVGVTSCATLGGVRKGWLRLVDVMRVRELWVCG